MKIKNILIIFVIVLAIAGFVFSDLQSELNDLINDFGGILK